MLNRIDFKKLRVFLEYAVYLLLAMLLQGLLFSRLSIFGVKGFVLGTSSLFGKGRSYEEIIPELRAL